VGKRVRWENRHAAQIRCRRKSRPDIRLVATTPDLRWKEGRSAGKKATFDSAMPMLSCQRSGVSKRLPVTVPTKRISGRDSAR